MSAAVQQKKHTLRLLKDTLLNTGLQGLVEERVEHVVGGNNVIVGADILLERLAAMECVSDMTLVLRHQQNKAGIVGATAKVRCDDVGSECDKFRELLTWSHCDP